MHNDEPYFPRSPGRKPKGAVGKIKWKLGAMFRTIWCLPSLEGDDDVVEESFATLADGLQRASHHADEIEIEDWIVCILLASRSRSSLTASIVDCEWSLEKVNRLYSIKLGCVRLRYEFIP